MKKLILSLFLATMGFHGYAKTWTVLSSGMTFSPETVTINQGDSVKFTIDGSHNAVEVNQTVWNANGTTSNGGFSIPFGGGTVVPSKLAVGTHYYVCTPHASFGMKGKIIVQAATSLEEAKSEKSLIALTNPISDRINIQRSGMEKTVVEIVLYDLQGRLVITLVPKTYMDGSFQLSFERPAEMAAGVYLLKTNLGSKTIVQKVVAL